MKTKDLQPSLFTHKEIIMRFYSRFSKTSALTVLLLMLNILTLLGQPRQVILEGFWWNCRNDNYPNRWADYLTELTPRLRDLGIDGVWVMPSVKNSGSTYMGYSPFDHYDLGDKYQKGFLKTILGDKNDLLRMVGVMHANNINVIQDIVFNHVDGAGSANGGGGEDPNAWDNKWKNFRYVSFTTPATDESPADYLSRSGRFPKNWQNFHRNPAHDCGDGDICASYFGPDVCYWEGAYGQSSNATYNPIQSSNHMRNGMRDWSIWYKKQVGFDGVRLDAVKHFEAWAAEDFLYNLQHNAGWASGGNDMSAVGEWADGGSGLDQWCSDVSNRSGTFDFRLRNALYGIVSGGGYYNLGDIPGAQQTNRGRTVPFVNNHDTYRPQLDANGVITGWNSGSELLPHIESGDVRISLCYAIIMAVDGSPQIFMDDLFNLNNGKRYSHKPTSTTDLPVRDDILNLIWCRQNLNFMGGAYKVRSGNPDHLIIERSGKAVISMNDTWADWKEEWIDTDFPAWTVLKDYSGASNHTVTVQADHRVPIKTPPCDGTAGNGRRGYAVWAPVGAAVDYIPTRSTTTTQEWEMADDLGDSHPNSLQEGGRLPANSTESRTIGEIYVAANTTVTFDLYTELADKNTSINLTQCSTTKTGSGTGNYTYTCTFDSDGWVTLKIRNTDETNPAQKVWAKVTYTAPAVVNTTPLTIICPADRNVNLNSSCSLVVPDLVTETTVSGNCTYNITQSPVAGTVISSANNQTHTVTITATDAKNNTASCNVVLTGKDVTPPTIVCLADITASSDAGSCTAATVNIGTATATDNCSATVNGVRSDGLGLTAPYPFGVTSITWTATDSAENSASCTQTVNINKVTTNTTVTVTPTKQQYSDQVTFKATVTPYNCGGAGTAATSVTFKVGSQVMGTVALDATGVAEATYVLLEPSPYGTDPTGQMAPGVHTVTAVFNGTDPDFDVPEATTDVTVSCEDAEVTFTGENYFTANPNNGFGTIAPSAFVVDNADLYRGDIRNATVTFHNGSSSGSVIGTDDIPVGLINPAITTDGFATTNENYQLTGGEMSDGGKSWTVWTTVNNYYCTQTVDPAIITLAMPGTNYITGGGYNIMSKSSGQYPGATGKKMNFGLVMKWNKSGKNLQGNINIIYRGTDGYNYQIKSNAINSLAISAITGYSKAVISTKANLTRLLPDGTSVSLGGNISLTVTALQSTTDNTGKSDRIGVQLAGANGSGIYFSSNWSGGKTVEQVLNGGKIQVKSASSSVKSADADMQTPLTPTSEDATNSLSVYPNPFTDQVFFDLQSAKDTRARLDIFDASGFKIATVFDALIKGNERYRIEYAPATNLVTGMLFYRLTIDDKVFNGKVIYAPN